MFNEVSKYWETCFPFDVIVSYFTNKNKYALEHKEFAFGEYYQRYSKQNKTPWRFTTVHELIKHLCVHKFNTFYMGPTYLPGNNRKDPYVTHPRPLCFDIDLDDYHAEVSTNRPIYMAKVVRTCECKARTCCDICWKEIAVKPIKDCFQFFKQVMQFKEVLCIFSGNRGFWFIILDPDVWEWDQISRECIVKRVPAIVDIKVTTQGTHLMKIPLTPHKTTGLICQPIDEYFLPSQAVHYSKMNLEVMTKFIEILKKI